MSALNPPAGRVSGGAPPASAGGAAFQPPDSPSGSWTESLRTRIVHVVPEGEALPDRQPVYVSSWIYVFGVLTMAALAVVIATGGVLAVGGAAWWHTSGLGHFVNSLHLWSVELFFAFMVIHLWGKFWMAAWRGGRAMTWVTGVVAFLGSVGTAFGVLAGVRNAALFQVALCLVAGYTAGGAVQSYRGFFACAFHRIRFAAFNKTAFKVFLRGIFDAGRGLLIAVKHATLRVFPLIKLRRLGRKRSQQRGNE